MNNQHKSKYWQYSLVVILITAIISGVVSNRQDHLRVQNKIVENLRLNHSLSISKVTGKLEVLVEEISLIALNKRIIAFAWNNAYTHLGVNAIDERFDSWAKNLVEHFSYYDLLMISTDGDIFYSVAKEDDLGSNLLTGPYSSSNLGKLFKEIKESQSFKGVDFAVYEPSNNTLAAFIGMPIFYRGEMIGALTLQLPTTFVELNIGVHIENIQDYILTSNYIYQKNKSFKSKDSLQFGEFSKDSFSKRNDSLFLYTPFKLKNMEWGILSIAPPIVFSENISWTNIWYRILISVLIATIASVLVTERLVTRFQGLNYSVEDIVLVQNTWNQFMYKKPSFGTDFYFRLKNKLNLKLGEEYPDIELLGSSIEVFTSKMVNQLANEEELNRNLVDLAKQCKSLNCPTSKVLKMPNMFLESLEDELGEGIPIRAKQAWNKTLKSLTYKVIRLMNDV